MHGKSVGANRHTQKTTKKAEQVGMDRRTYKRFQQPQKTNNSVTILSTLQLEKRKHTNNRRQHKRTFAQKGATLWQKQKDGNLKPIGFASRFLSDTEKKYAINELELLAVVWGLEHFRLYIYGKPIELLTDHQALEPIIKRNRSNKTYSARITRWLDRLPHFDNQIKHVADKHLKLTDHLSRKPISRPEPIENYDEEYVINCIIPLLEFINNYGSITDERNNDANEPKELAQNEQPIKFKIRAEATDE